MKLRSAFVAAIGIMLICLALLSALGQSPPVSLDGDGAPEVSGDAPMPRPTPRLFDRFGALTFNDLKARLDNYAIELQQEPEATGYIVGYDGRNCRSRGQARNLAKRAQSYLFFTRGIDPRRVVYLNGGRNEELAFILYVSPLGEGQPAVTPQLPACPRR